MWAASAVGRQGSSTMSRTIDDLMKIVTEQRVTLDLLEGVFVPIAEIVSYYGEGCV